MASDQISSKLAVILHADVASSTALVQLDRELAHRRIQEVFRDLGERIGNFQGRVLELRGDALLAEFEHAADAIAAALSFQSDRAADRVGPDDDIRPEMRVGISLGEVVVADGTVTGAGVVQAQRIEQLAEPGGVCVTAAVQEAIPRRMPFAFENLGDQTLQGFEYPVRVFKVELRDGETIPSSPPGASSAATGPWRWAVIAALVIALAAILYVGLQRPMTPDAPISDETAAVPLPDKPSIAVLPFNNMSSDTEHEYFADGMTEDLITDLSKISGLFVISRHSVFPYKGKTISIRQVAQDLGVHYVLEGSVRKAGNQIRINTQLIDASTEGHVWAERFDGTYDDVFQLQDQVTSKVVATLAIKLTEGEQAQISQVETGSTAAYDTFLKGWEQYQRQRPESFNRAIELFEESIRIDPAYSRAYAALSATYWQVYKRYWHERVGVSTFHDVRFLAEQNLDKAMQQPSTLAYQVSASILAHQGQHDKAISHGERAIALDPNDADAYAALAGVLNLAGQPNEALSMIERAMRLNPHYPASYLYEIGLARFGVDDFEGAARALEKAIAINPTDRWSSRLMISTLGHLGRKQDAALEIDRVADNWRGFDPLSVRSTAFWYPFEHETDANRLAEGLRKAGVPD